MPHYSRYNNNNMNSQSVGSDEFPPCCVQTPGTMSVPTYTHTLHRKPVVYESVSTTSHSHQVPITHSYQIKNYETRTDGAKCAKPCACPCVARHSHPSHPHPHPHHPVHAPHPHPAHPPHPQQYGRQMRQAGREMRQDGRQMRRSGRDMLHDGRQIFDDVRQMVQDGRQLSRHY